MIIGDIASTLISDSSKKILVSTPKKCSALHSKWGMRDDAICDKDMDLLPLPESEKWIAKIIFGKDQVYLAFLSLFSFFVILPFIFKLFIFINKKLIIFFSK